MGVREFSRKVRSLYARLKLWKIFRIKLFGVSRGYEKGFRGKGGFRRNERNYERFRIF